MSYEESALLIASFSCSCLFLRLCFAKHSIALPSPRARVLADQAPWLTSPLSFCFCLCPGASLWEADNSWLLASFKSKPPRAFPVQVAVW